MKGRPPATIGSILEGSGLPEIAVGMALQGNPGDAAVACVLGQRRLGRRLGTMSSYEAAYHGVEFALDCAIRGSLALAVVTCQSNACSPPAVTNEKYGAVGSRIHAKLKKTGSIIVFRRKRDDLRFELANEFAKTVLLSGDAQWQPDAKQTEDAIRSRIEDQAEDKLESPPESDIYRELRHYFPDPVMASPDPACPWRKVQGFSGEHGVLIPQLRLGRYRLDFGVIGNRINLAIEIDGWTYHNSRSSFENDRKRDRELQKIGWNVFRYPASDAKYQPMQCADEIIDMLRGPEDAP